MQDYNDIRTTFQKDREMTSGTAVSRGEVPELDQEGAAW